MTTYTGPMTITTPGTVIEGMAINGPLVIDAADVVIKDCSIHYASTWGIDASNASNVTVENCTIVGGGTSVDGNSAILGSGNFIGNNISAAENGISLMGGASTVEGNYIHDLSDGGSDPHYDGISVQGGQNGVLIQNNTISGRDTSDIFIKDDFGAINNVTVTHNLLIGNPGYDLYVDGRGGHGAITNVSVTDNYVQTGFYGNFSVDQSSPTISGNVTFAQGSSPSQTISSSTPTTGTSTTGSGTSDTGTTHTTAPSTPTSGSSSQTSDPSSSTSSSSTSHTTDPGTTTSGSSTSGTGSTSTNHHSWSDSFNFGNGSGHHHGGWASSSPSATTASTTTTADPTTTSHDVASSTTTAADSSHHDFSNWWHHDNAGYADHFTM